MEAEPYPGLQDLALRLAASNDPSVLQRRQARLMEKTQHSRHPAHSLWPGRIASQAKRCDMFLAPPWKGRYARLNVVHGRGLHQCMERAEERRRQEFDMRVLRSEEPWVKDDR